MTNQALILFDIDGTLLQAGDRAHAQALLDAFRDVFGLEPDLDGVALAGMLDAQIVRQLLAKHDVDVTAAESRLADVMELMGDRYIETTNGISLHERLLPGVEQTVRGLKNQGYVIGTLTGNARTVGETKLRLAGLEHLTHIGAYGDSAHERYELVQIALDLAAEVVNHEIPSTNVLLIGDTPQDIAAAKQAGSQVLAVATGRYDETELAWHSPDAVVADLSDSDTINEIAFQLINTSQARGSNTWKAAR